MTLQSFNVRELVGWSEDAIAGLPPIHEIVFEDGSKITALLNQTRYSHLFWAVLRAYPRTRILPKHHLATIIKEGSLDTDSHNKLCSALSRSVIEDEGLAQPIQKEPLLELVYRTISYAMTMISFWSEEDVTSIDILDFIQAAHHPRIKALKQEAMADPKNKIKYAYEQGIDVLKTDPVFEENGLAKAMRSAMVKPNQVQQCILFRGIVTEVDGAIFTTPVWGNYTTGMRKFYDFVADSRLAPKAHFYSDTALKDSEYMGRKFQLYSTVIERMDMRDCGSQQYVPWFVQPPVYDSSGTETYPGDLKYLVGKYYLDEKTQSFKWIEGNEKHLNGTKIYMRSTIHCKAREHDRHAVCHVCIGKLSENISRFANLGHLGSIATTRQTTQNILSIKHVNTSASALKVMLGDFERRFMNTGPHGTAFYLNDHLKGSKPRLVILRDEASGLVNLKTVDDLEQLSPQYVSQLSTVQLLTQAKGVEAEVFLNTKQRDKPSMMTVDLLAYLKQYGWTTNNENNFVIDMAKWDYRKPIFVMEVKEESFVDLSKQIGKMVQSSQKNKQTRSSDQASVTLLRELFNVANSKLRINILSFELLISGLLVESPTSYAMPQGKGAPVLGVSELLTKYRSLGPALAYQEQHATLTDPINFFQGRRPGSPMDVFMCPREVVGSASTHGNWVN